MNCISCVWIFTKKIGGDLLSYIFRGHGKWKIGISLVIIAVLTMFNYAINGWDLQPIYTSDPNSTEAEQNWYQNKFFTWGTDNLEPKCQHTEITVGDQFMTTNLGLQYTVNAMSLQPYGSDSIQQISTVSYLNNTLENCQIDSINIALRKDDSAAQGDYSWWSWTDSYAEAMAHCNILNDDGISIVNFTASCATPVTVNATLATEYVHVAIYNATTHASVWWGIQLLNNYFTGLQYIMSRILSHSSLDFTLTAAEMGFFSGDATSIKDVHLFNPLFYFLNSSGSEFNQLLPDISMHYNNDSYIFSQPLTEGLFFAKVFSSLILVDLGNSQAPNLLLDPDMLQYALDPSNDFNRQPNGVLGSGPLSTFDSFKFRGISPPGQPHILANSVPMDQSYAAFSNQTGQLKTQNASIYTQYICQAPKKRSTPTILLLVVVADYVLFQLWWVLIKLSIKIYHYIQCINTSIARGHKKGDAEMDPVGRTHTSDGGTYSRIPDG
jgi:hypothetical protein